MNKSTVTELPKRQKITSQLFLKIWKGEQAISKKWAKSIQIIGGDPNSPTTFEFKNLDIEGDLFFESEDILNSLFLVNCHISAFTSKNSKFGAIIISKNTEIKRFRAFVSSMLRIIIEFAEVNDVAICDNSCKYLQINDSKINRLSLLRSAYHIPDNELDLQVIDQEENALHKKIEISDSIFDSISIEDSTSNLPITIKGSSINKGVIIAKSRIESLKILKSTINALKIQGGCFILRKSSIEESQCQNISIEDSTLGPIGMNKSKIETYFHIRRSITGNIDVLDSSQLKNMILDSSKSSNLNIYSSFVKFFKTNQTFVSRLRFFLPIEESIQILLHNSQFGSIHLSDSVFAEFTTMTLTNCKTNFLNIDRFCNYGTLFFSNLNTIDTLNDFKRRGNGQLERTENGEYVFEEIDQKQIPKCLRLIDSDLRRTQLINCDLRNFRRFEFSNTKMLEIFVAGSKMPDKSSFALPEGSNNNIYEQKRLAFGQFKKVYEGQGDVAGSLLYLADEMDAYLLQILAGKWWKKIGEILLLFFNKISTNYGNNWGQGALITLLVVFLCFGTYLRFIGYEIGNWNNPDNVNLFKTLYSYAPQYLNPFRDADSILPQDLILNFTSIEQETKEKILTPCARVWDYISRIFVAYFVYQTIQAFRKLGKSSG